MHLPLGLRIRTWSAAISLLGCIIWSVLAAPVLAQGTADRPDLEIVHALQGMQFVGSLLAEGETGPGEDALSFKDGEFTSRTCSSYGFPPAHYWVRHDEHGLHFRAELRSAEHGIIVFQGVFDGKQMRATALWTKRRWYWTIEQKLHFTGRPLRKAD